jgi:hypothetical protein
MANAAKQRMLDYVTSEFGSLEHTADSRKRLRFGTLLADLVPVNEWAIKETIDGDRVRMDKLRRDFPSIWFQGAFELELVNCERLFEMPGNFQKRMTLKALLGNRTHDPMMILVHSHGLYDLKDIPQDRFYGRVYRHYNKAPKQAYFSKTHADQSSFEDMCWKMGSYLFKSRVQFNMSFDSQGYRDERYFSDYDLSNLVMIYSWVMSNGPVNRGNKSLLIGANGR